MKSVHLSDWHMKQLIETLTGLLDTCFQVVPMLHKSGVKVFSQWHTFDARFYFAGKDAVEVHVSPGWNDIHRAALITAISHTFRWEYQPPSRLFVCCCVSWHKNQGAKLHFKM